MTDSVVDQPTPVRRRNARSDENVAAVRESVSEDLNLSIPRRAQELGLSQTSTWRILHKDLGLFLTRFNWPKNWSQMTICSIDNSLFVPESSWKSIPILAKKIIFSDEAHFWLNGFVNKQNCRIWGEHNPPEIQQRSLHSEKVTVWCGFWSGNIIGPYFIQNEAGAALTVNGERYRSMITDFFGPV